MWASFFHDFVAALKATTWPEGLAVIAGIASVLLSRVASVWLYPVGLVNSVFYVWLSMQGQLLGEASVNIFYTAVSLYGWWLWLQKKDSGHKPALEISFLSRRGWLLSIAATIGLYAALFLALRFAKEAFAPGAIPWADAFASATAYVGMWLMARKKVESWVWWIATDVASVPLYYAKGYAFTTVQFAVFTVLAVLGLVEWRRRASANRLAAIAA